MRILTITLLLLPVCLCTFVTDNPNSNSMTSAPKTVFNPCCVHVISANISSIITGNMYEKQTADGRCVEAIILRSNEGTVCADPKAKWVQNIIAHMTAGKS